MNTRRTQEYEEMKGRLVLRLMSDERASKKSYPGQIIGDMRLVYVIDSMDGSYHTITNEDLGRLGISQERLHEDAIMHTITENPAAIVPAHYDFHVSDGRTITLRMFRLTTTQGRFGAAALAYPEMLKILGMQVESDYSIIPYSSNECRILPDENYGAHDGYQLARIFKAALLKFEDRLSDSIYHYECATETLETLDEYMGRRMLQSMFASDRK